MAKKIMMVAGEASGDLHGASLARALKAAEPDVQIFGVGGRGMREAGVELVADIANLGVVGFIEVIKHLGMFRELMARLDHLLDAQRPDVLVIIDYPGFNMRLARIAKAKGVPVVYYISPTVWAWGRGRAREIAQTCAHVAAIFPFEAEVYEQEGAAVTFVGHPLLDVAKPALPKEKAFALFGADPAGPVVTLMPGSRMQEIDHLLPVMLGTARIITRALPSTQFFLPLATTVDRDRVESMIAGYGVSVTITSGNTYDLMHISTLIIAASGTATLEAALVGTPTIIVYRLSPLTYLLGKMVVKIPFIGMPNIIAGRMVMPEFLQGAANPDNVAAEALAILNDPDRQREIRENLTVVRKKLGQPGAVHRTAAIVLRAATSHH